jgi:hypothetical protein
MECGISDGFNLYLATLSDVWNFKSNHTIKFPPGPASLLYFIRFRHARIPLKISRDELEVFSQEPIELFNAGIKSPVTKHKYIQVLRKILCHTR